MSVSIMEQGFPSYLDIFLWSSLWDHPGGWGKSPVDEAFYDAFFKYPTKPKLTTHGHLYHEGKQFEALVSEKEIFAGKKVRKDQVDKGKRGIEKQPFQLTDFTATGIEKIIHGHIEKETKATSVYVVEDGRNGFCLSDVYCWQDGAIVANNPSIFTIREAQLLWPQTNIYCLVSSSCGSFTYKGLRFILHAIDLPEYFFFCRKEKVVGVMLIRGQVLIESACSVDGVEALSTLLPMLPEMQYFRFNPG
ncbi:hypothetical protein COLO4_09520 [Corchorus olitorius]|uniref:Uncharacterized protein n=1 Tax=Corchorus olitorius TaxID=93759 RepID=A0A1R3KBZ9_9ROSI|nr:hypothetical protein COLO4_09520 [Corchorus olitorius]